MKKKRIGYYILALVLAVSMLLSLTVIAAADEGGPPSDEPVVVQETPGGEPEGDPSGKPSDEPEGGTVEKPSDEPEGGSSEKPSDEPEGEHEEAHEETPGGKQEEKPSDEPTEEPADKPGEKTAGKTEALTPDEKAAAAAQTWSEGYDGKLHYSGSEAFENGWGYEISSEIPEEEPIAEPESITLDPGWHRAPDGTYYYVALVENNSQATVNIAGSSAVTDLKRSLAQLSGVPVSSSSASSKKGQSG